MSEIKLFPCPLCGAEVTLSEIEPHTHVDCKGEFFIECKCGCSIMRDTVEKAIVVWNNRKPIEDMVESVKVENRRFLKEMYHLHGNNYETTIAKKHNDKVIQIVRGGRE